MKRFRLMCTRLLFTLAWLLYSSHFIFVSLFQKRKKKKRKEKFFVRVKLRVETSMNVSGTLCPILLACSPSQIFIFILLELKLSIFFILFFLEEIFFLEMVKVSKTNIGRDRANGDEKEEEEDVIMMDMCDDEREAQVDDDEADPLFEHGWSGEDEREPVKPADTCGDDKEEAKIGKSKAEKTTRRAKVYTYEVRFNEETRTVSGTEKEVDGIDCLDLFGPFPVDFDRSRFVQGTRRNVKVYPLDVLSFDVFAESVQWHQNAEGIPILYIFPRPEKKAVPGGRTNADLRRFYKDTPMQGLFRCMEMKDRSLQNGNGKKKPDAADWLHLHGYDGEAISKQNFDQHLYYHVSGGIAVVVPVRIWKSLLMHVPAELKHLVSPAIIKGSRLAFCLVHLSTDDALVLIKTLRAEKEKGKDAFDRWILAEFCKRHDGFREDMLAGKQTKKAAAKWLSDVLPEPEVVAVPEIVPMEVDQEQAPDVFVNQSEPGQEYLDVQRWLENTPDMVFDGSQFPPAQQQEFVVVDAAETTPESRCNKSTRYTTGAGKRPREDVQKMIDAHDSAREVSIVVPSGKFPCQDHQVLIDAASEVELTSTEMKSRDAASSRYFRFKRVRFEDDTKSSDDEEEDVKRVRVEYDTKSSGDDGYAQHSTPLEPLSVEAELPQKRETLLPSLRLIYGPCIECPE